MIFKRFFSHSGYYPSYEMFSLSHFMLILLSIIFIAFLLYKSRKTDKNDMINIIKRCTLIMWCMEIIKIVFNISQGNIKNINTYVPLYYCSLPLYCGIGSVFAKGVFKKISDVFLLFGGITGGTAYILFPCTTAGTYPAMHFITLQSFVHHSLMIYLGIMLVKTGYTDLKLKNIKYYSALIVIASVIAFAVNLIFDSNLMFVSKCNPGTPTEILYNLCPPLYPLLVTSIQAFLPYFIIYGPAKMYRKHQQQIN